METMHNTTAIVPSVSIANLLNQRDAVLERVMQAIAILAEATDLATAAHVGMPRFLIDHNRYGTHNIAKDDSARKTVQTMIDREAWQYLMNESGLRSMMDAKSREEWNKSIEKGNFPELTDGNIRATFHMLHDARGDMFERGVLDCFKYLSWDYKTNRPFGFGKRIVLRGCRGSEAKGRWGSTRTDTLGHVNMHTTDKLDDLTRVFSVLDGKPEPDHRQGWYGLLNNVRYTTDDDAQNDYLSVRSFRNGNGHATFKRPDLVEKMNAILAKHYPGGLAYDKRAA